MNPGSPRKTLQSFLIRTSMPTSIWNQYESTFQYFTIYGFNLNDIETNSKLPVNPRQSMRQHQIQYESIRNQSEPIFQSFSIQMNPILKQQL